ncbi:MAG: MBL fold metallo-hydrolase [Candidatus Thorarchaeota archaeon]|nr:MAG: MBL fold metallo-hydrolase [Candidatus Thorarchaeota archaeon]
MTVTIRYLGHAGFQIKTEDESIYIDLYRAKKYVERVSDVSEKATIILATHGHNDHCHPESIVSVQAEDSIIIAPEDCGEKVKGDFRPITIGDEIEIRGVKIRAVPAYNISKFRSPGNPYHPKDYGVGYVITIGGKTIYHAGDTDVIPEMESLGPIDVAMIPVGDTYTMDNKEGAEAASTIKPKTVIPMHTWDKGTEDFKKALEETTEISIQEMVEGDEITL